MVFDGTGAPGQHADEALDGGQISWVGHADRAPARRMIDASAMASCRRGPGGCRALAWARAGPCRRA